MITGTLKKLSPLKFSADRYGPDFDICVRKFHMSKDGLDFTIGISGNGFDAFRNLTRDDLIEIRDWINEALAVSEMESTA